MGGRDRLDRSVRLEGGPNLLARPNCVVRLFDLINQVADMSI